MNETLYLVIPCYNEQEVLPETARRLDEKLGGMIAVGIVSKDSRVLFVDDGSRDLAPLNHLPNCNGAIYNLQLSMYAFAVEYILGLCSRIWGFPTPGSRSGRR